MQGKSKAKALEELKADRALEKALHEVDEHHLKRIEEPSKWFGWLLATLIVAVFLDTTGWWAAFVSGKFYAAFATVLQTVETICILGLAALAIHGAIESYRLQGARKKVVREHKG